MPSVDRTEARLTEPPSLAPPAAPFLPPGTARTTSVSPEFLPERSVGPEAWAPGSDHVDETLSGMRPSDPRLVPGGDGLVEIDVSPCGTPPGAPNQLLRGEASSSAGAGWARCILFPARLLDRVGLPFDMVPIIPKDEAAIEIHLVCRVSRTRLCC